MLKTNIVAVRIWQYIQPYPSQLLHVTIMMSVDQSQIMDAKEMIGLHAVDVVYCRAQKDHVPG